MKKVKTGVSKWHVARMRCADCGINVVKVGEYNYMAATKLWQKATAGSDDIRFLCIGCFEQRLGRNVHLGDIWPTPIYDFLESTSDRLLDRFRYVIEAT
jgi:hypothetical protein